MKMFDHMLLERASSDQMISTIRMFESSRPENLLLFSKVFLHLNTDRRYVNKPAICSTTLQKYVFDKWVNVMNKLRHKNALVRKSKAFYRANLLGKCLSHLRERVQQKKMRVEVSTILEGYRQGSTIRRCFNGIREYARQRRRMHQVKAEISESRAISLLQRSFCNWYNKLQLSQSIRQTESSLTDARDYRLMKKAL